MRNKVEVIGSHETAGDVFFTVEITDKDGDSHTDVYSENLLGKFIREGVSIEVDEDDRELVNELNNAELGYVEVVEEEEGDTGKTVYDVYFHGVKVVDGELEYDFAGEFLRTYKTEKGARRFADNYIG